MSMLNQFPAPAILDREIILQESIFSIQKDTLQQKEGHPYFYYSLITPPTAVIILAFTPEGSYLLTEEYRHPTRQVLLSCPGGFIDLEEDAMTAAKRELLEETGFKAEEMEIIGKAFPYAGFSRQETIYIRATNVVLAATPKLEASELIQTRLIQASDLKQMIQQGCPLDGTLCTALFFHQQST